MRCVLDVKKIIKPEHLLLALLGVFIGQNDQILLPFNHILQQVKYVPFHIRLEKASPLRWSLYRE